MKEPSTKPWYRDRRVFAWALYDWADSAFATTVMAGFFPLFFKQVYHAGAPAETVTLHLGITNSLAGLIIAVAAPILGAIADAHFLKRRFLMLFTLIGVVATAGLFFPEQGSWLAAALFYAVAITGFNGAVVFYDSFLPEASEGHSREIVSSYGYALGYLGGGLLFAVNVLMFLHPEWFGIADPSLAIRYSFLSVGIWWGVFAIPLVTVFKEPAHTKISGGLKGAFSQSLTQLWHTLLQLLQLKTLLLFLLGYWLYIDGINTVIKMAVDYGVSLGFDSSHLIGALLVTQFVGFPSAIVFGHVGRRLGSKISILIGLVIYIGVTLFAALMDDVSEFYVLAIVVGLVQGGVQALSRSFFSEMVPTGKEAEFFSFFNIVGKFATIVGPILVGTTAYVSGSPRIGVASVIILFVAGTLLLSFVPDPARKNHDS